MIPFARLASADSPSPGELALALAAELQGADTSAAAAVLSEMADAMAAARELDALGQLAHCGEVTAERIAAELHPAEVEGLMLDRVLARGRGDPVCWAVACVDAANQAGIPLGVVADEEDHVLVAHRRLLSPLVLEPLAPQPPLDAEQLPASDLSWRCGHETTLILLDRLVARALRAGRLREAVRAADLRLELPLGDAMRAQLIGERRRLAARLN